MALLPDGDLIHCPKHIVVHIIKIQQTRQITFAFAILLHFNVDALSQVLVPLPVVMNQRAMIDVNKRPVNFLTLRFIQDRIEAGNRRFHFGSNQHIDISTQRHACFRLNLRTMHPAIA